MITTILATIALATAPTVEFTSDSAYKNEHILDYSLTQKTVCDVDDYGVIVSQTESYTLNVKQNYVLGYDVYDNPDTPYIEGVKVDGAFLLDTWSVPDFDPEDDHVVTIKTVYSDDIAGWFARAKSGDFSAIMSNPIMIMQLIYYILAAVSLVLGGMGLLKSRKTKIKTAEDIAKAVQAQADSLGEKAASGLNDMEASALTLVADIVAPLVETLSKQNETLIKATVLARNGDEESTLALLELLKNTGAAGIENISETVRKRILESKAKSEEAKREALKAMKEAVSAIPAPDKAPGDGFDGTSI